MHLYAALDSILAKVASPASVSDVRACLRNSALTLQTAADAWSATFTGAPPSPGHTSKHPAVSTRPWRGSPPSRLGGAAPRTRTKRLSAAQLPRVGHAARDSMARPPARVRGPLHPCPPCEGWTESPDGQPGGADGHRDHRRRADSAPSVVGCTAHFVRGDPRSAGDVGWTRPRELPGIPASLVGRSATCSRLTASDPGYNLECQKADMRSRAIAFQYFREA